MNSIAVTAETFSAHEKRLNTLDRRVTKMETTMTSITPHLATKADINKLLCWIVGILVGFGALIHTSQTRMEGRLERSMDVRFESVNARFEQVERHLDQVDRRLEQVDKRLERVEQRLDRVETRLERVEQRLERVEQSVFTPASTRQTR